VTYGPVEAPPAERQPIDWEEIRKAIEEWLSKLVFANQPTDVIWEDQGTPRPALPYLSLKRTAGPSRLGSVDETREGQDLTQPLGKEIEIQKLGPRAFTLTIQAHTAQPLSMDLDAFAILSKIEASLDQDETLEIFDDAGLSKVGVEGIVDLSQVENSDWISRAALDIRFNTMSVITKRTGYIDKVQVSSDDPEVEFEVDAS
jgi:hypothetical protein